MPLISESTSYTAICILYIIILSVIIYSLVWWVTCLYLWVRWINWSLDSLLQTVYKVRQTHINHCVTMRTKHNSWKGLTICLVLSRRPFHYLSGKELIPHISIIRCSNVIPYLGNKTTPSFNNQTAYKPEHLSMIQIFSLGKVHETL